jgi:hypothetical protein
LDGSPFGLLSKDFLPKPFMVIKHDISAKYGVVPPDEAGKAMQAQVEEELSSIYLTGRPGYRVAVAEAKHMTFSDMVVLPIWAEAARRFGVENAAMVRKLWLGSATIVKHSLTCSCWAMRVR